MTFLHLIADYGTGDPAFGEVIHRFKAIDDSIDVHPTAVPAFSSIATGFWIAQYGLYNPAFKDLAIYANTAPRKDDTDPQHDNRGEELVHSELDNGVPVIAVNLPALGAMLGTFAGLFVLMHFVMKGRPHAGLPLLNGGAIGGYVLGSLVAGISLIEALGLSGFV